MTPAEFREAGHRVVDWIADYWERLEGFPVLSRRRPGEVLGALPEQPPTQGESLEEVLADLERVILPGLTHWQHPSFFAYFPANASGPAVLGDLLSSGLGIQGMLWATSPAATELETRTLDWLAAMLDLPESFRSTSTGGGVIQDSASSATLVALLAARERVTEGEANRSGAGNRLVAYTSSEGHSSIEKGVRVAGMGSDNLRRVAVDDTLAMRADALEATIRADRERGMIPTVVAATVGTTSSTAVDPLREIGEVCRRYGVWLHVDAAYAGTAAVLPELRWIHDGLELADSYVFDPHKWMLTNFDCSAFYVADRAHLIRTLSVLPEYLRNQATESGAVIDYRDWHIPLGRRFRALKLWLVLRHYGVEGVQAHVRRAVELAAWLAEEVEQHPDFELMAPVHFGLVCLRHRAGDQVNQQIMDSLNRSGELYLTHTRIRGLLTLRVAIGAPTTGRRHVERAWEAIRGAGEAS